MKLLFAPGSDRPNRVLEPLRAAGIEVQSVIYRPNGLTGKLQLMSDSFAASMTDDADVILTDVCTAAYMLPLLHEFIGHRPIILRPRADVWQEDENRNRHSRFSSVRSFFSPRLLQFFYHQADAIIPVSAFLGDCISKNTGLDRSEFTVINEPVDMQRFSPVSRADSLRIRAEMDLDFRHLICIIGSFVYDDKVAGIDHFLPALHQLVERHRDVAVVIAGDGPRHGPFLERNSRWLRHPRLIVQGFVNQVERLYQATDICAHFSFFDSLALVLFEAWSCELPVVVNDYPALRENVLPGETGYILSNDSDPDEALQVFEKLIFDEGHRRQMGKAGREYVRRNASCEKIAGQLRAVIEKLCS